MSSEDQALEVTGQVLAVLGNNNYLVRLSQESQERDLLCHLSGKMRRFKINVIVGDTVRVILTPPYDRGRICYREK